MFEEWISHTIRQKEKKARELKLLKIRHLKDSRLTNLTFKGWVMMKNYGRYLRKVIS